MKLVNYLIDFSIAVVLLTAVWLAFIFINHYLVKVKCPMIQEVAGAVLALAVVVAAGMIFGTFGLGLFVGVFLVVVYFFIRRTLRKYHSDDSGAAA